MIHSIARCMLAVLTLLQVASSAPAQGKPAVDEPNLRLSSGYRFDYRDQDVVDLDSLGNAIAFSPERRSHSFDAGATLTLPLLRSVGGRIRFAAGAQRRDVELEHTAFGSRIDFEQDDWGWQIQTGLDLFLRNPDLGYLEAGYTYRYDEIGQVGLREETSHLGSLKAGWFLSPSGMMPIDLEARFGYLRATRQLRTLSFGASAPFFSTSKTTFPVYQIEGLASLYLGDRLRVGLGGLYSFADLAPLTNQWERETSAVAELLWLAGAGRQSSVTVGLRATAGEARLASSLANFEVPVASVGIEISLLYPGSDSLLQLVRERR